MNHKLIKISLWLVGVSLIVAATGFTWFSRGFETQQITERVYLISSSNGANVTVLKGNDSLFIVDSQLKLLGAFLKKNIKKVSLLPIKYIVNTHWHPDHNGGNGSVGKNAIIIGHENLKKRMKSSQEGYGLTKPGSHHKFKPRKAGDLPDKTFKDSLKINFQGEDIVISHMPGAHTDTDTVVYFTQSNVLCVGDLIWKDQFPYVDNFNKGSVVGLGLALDRLIASTDSNTKIISGHTSVSSREDLIKTREMINQTVALIENKINGGQTLSEIQKEGLPGMESWSSDLVPANSWIEMVYESISR